jgi:hypothetical protein
MDVTPIAPRIVAIGIPLNTFANTLLLLFYLNGWEAFEAFQKKLRKFKSNKRGLEW